MTLERVLEAWPSNELMDDLGLQGDRKIPPLNAPAFWLTPDEVRALRAELAALRIMRDCELIAREALGCGITRLDDGNYLYQNLLLDPPHDESEDDGTGLPLLTEKQREILTAAHYNKVPE